MRADGVGWDPYSKPLNFLNPTPPSALHPEGSSEPLSRCILKAGLRLGPEELLHLELPNKDSVTYCRSLNC